MLLKLAKYISMRTKYEVYIIKDIHAMVKREHRIKDALQSQGRESVVDVPKL